MNRQKLATICCIVLSIAFSLSFGLVIHFKVFLPYADNYYEEMLHYPEALYEEYKEEAERMIATHEYSSKYHAKTILYSENNQITALVIEIGEYDKKPDYSNYITATVKNFGTSEQEVTFKRSIKSAKRAIEMAKRFRIVVNIGTGIFIVILFIFTVWLIKSSIKKEYSKVLISILCVLAGTAIIIAERYIFVIAH